MNDGFWPSSPDENGKPGAAVKCSIYRRTSLCEAFAGTETHGHACDAGVVEESTVSEGQRSGQGLDAGGHTSANRGSQAQ